MDRKGTPNQSCIHASGDSSMDTGQNGNEQDDMMSCSQLKKVVDHDIF